MTKQKPITDAEYFQLNDRWSAKYQDINLSWGRTCEKIISDGKLDYLTLLTLYMLMNTLWAIILLQVI